MTVGEKGKMAVIQDNYISRKNPYSNVKLGS